MHTELAMPGMMKARRLDAGGGKGELPATGLSAIAVADGGGGPAFEHAMGTERNQYEVRVD